MAVARSRKEVAARRYYDRKACQKCVTCAATLQEDDGALCVECAEINVVYRKRYRYSPKGRRAARRHHDRVRALRIAAGHCTRCDSPDLSIRADGKPGRMCAPCAAEHVEVARASKARKAAGVITLSTARARIKRARAPNDRNYVPIEDRIARPRYRLLRAMLFLDWTPSIDLLTIAGAPQLENDRVRNTMAKSLERLVRDGFVEYRGPRCGRDYQLTPTGVELARRVEP